MQARFLTSLTLSHFRSHKRADLAFDTRPVAIFGPNGAGKTNILEAISLFSPGRGLRRATAADMTRTPEGLGWKLTAQLQSNAQTYDLSLTSEGGAPRQTRIDGKTTPQTALAHVMRVVWLVPSQDRLWIEGAEGRRRFLDRIVLSFFPDHAELSLTYEKSMRERNRLLKDGIRDAMWYEVLERQMAQTGARIHQNRRDTLARLAKAQADATTGFPYADLELSHPDHPLPQSEAEMKDALAQSRPRDIAAGRSLVGVHRADMAGVFAAKGENARDCSTGEQKALLISLILANARALAQDTGAAPILLLDEVSAHLDETRRGALYDEICALGAQAFLTGTERGLFADLGKRAQYLHVREEGAISLVSEHS